MLFNDVWDTENPINLMFSYKKNAPEQQPMIAPTPPVEEASVDIGDEDDKDMDKLKTSKDSLKVPLAKIKDSDTTGVRY